MDKCSSCCASCCASCWGYSRVNKDDDEERVSLVKDSASSKYDWERHVIEAMVMPTGKVSKSAIVSYNDGALRASAPEGFTPDRKGIKDIIRALQGDTAGVAERGIVLQSGTPVYIPGKIDLDKAIYCSDGQGGGCCVFKSGQCILIVMYEGDAASATRLASEVAEYMKDQGH